MPGLLMQDQKKAYGYGLATVLLWSTVASVFKLSLRYLDPIQLLFYACIFSILALATILALQGKTRLIFSCSGRQYLKSMAFGFLNPFLYYTILLEAYDLLPAQEVQPLKIIPGPDPYYCWAHHTAD